MSIVAIIPARGGSVGIPRKNVHLVGGRPLICWSITAAVEAASVDRVIVTTDDDEIAQIAREAGAEVPFRRPAELGGAEVPDLPVFQHALRWLAEEETYRPELVVHLRPTSPARPGGLIDEAIEMLRVHPAASSLRSVSPSPVTPWKMWQMDAKGMLRPLLGTLEQEAFNQPRQALPPAWLHDGVIDVVHSEVILGGSMSGARILAFPLEAGLAVDIDHPEDLAAAERALARIGGGRS